jgi:hypothetical protein
MIEYFYQIGTREFGPCSANDLRRLAADGIIDLHCHIRRGRDGQWVSAVNVVGLFKPPASPSRAPTTTTALAHRPVVPPRAESATSPFSFGAGDPDSSAYDLPIQTPVRRWRIDRAAVALFLVAGGVSMAFGTFALVDTSQSMPDILGAVYWLVAVAAFASALILRRLVELCDRGG